MAKYLVLKVRLFDSEEDTQVEVTDSLNELLQDLVTDLLVDDHDDNGWAYSIEEGD